MSSCAPFSPGYLDSRNAEGFNFWWGRPGRDIISSCAMPSNKKKAPSSERDYAVGDRVTVNLHTGRIVEATVKAVIERTGGKRLQVDFGKDETALVYLWQVVEKVR